MLTDETIARLKELAFKWAKLKKWGVKEKLPFTRETLADLDRFFVAGLKGEIDVTEIQGVTADIQRLEKLAEEYDEKNGGNFRGEKLTTTFDIENATETVRAAKKAIDASNEARVAARDAAKDGFSIVKDAAKEVPWWAWAAGGTVLVTFVLSQLATISKAFGSGK